MPVYHFIYIDYSVFRNLGCSKERGIVTDEEFKDAKTRLLQSIGSSPASDESGRVDLRIVYQGQFIFNDVQVETFLDGKLLGIGSLREGFTLTASVIVGKHTLLIKIADYPVPHSEQLDFPQAGPYLVRVGISWRWYEGSGFWKSDACWLYYINFGVDHVHS